MKPQAIAVDLGGTSLRAARIDHEGMIHDRAEVLTKSQEGPEAVLDQIATIVSTIKERATDIEILGVGVSSPGPLDTTRGVALGLPTIKGFDNYPLLATLRDRLKMPVRLENDAIAAAIGEWRHGAGLGFANLVYVTVSTGIGGGVIVDNHVLRGRQGMACHIGHMVLVPNGTRCNCGNLGCLEAYASGPAFADRAKLRSLNNSASSLHSLGQNLKAESIFAAAKAGDRLALELVGEEINFLATGFISLAHLFSPDVIIMGGGLSNAFDLLSPEIAAYFTKFAMPAFKTIQIVRAKLAGNSGLVGAAALTFEAL